MNIYVSIFKHIYTYILIIMHICRPAEARVTLRWYSSWLLIVIYIPIYIYIHTLINLCMYIYILVYIRIIYRPAEARVTLRWYSSWVLIVACVPVVVLYMVWAFFTLNGRITGMFLYVHKCV
jgi:hypothetical protein